MALEILGGLQDDEEPAVVVQAIDKYFVQLQDGRRKLHWDEWHEVYAPLGALWGEQICFKYGWSWYWVWLDEDQGEWRYALMPKDKSLIILPFEHLSSCVDEGRTVSVLRIFEAIEKNPVLGEFGPGDFVDIASNPSLLVWDE